jgi:hypothetical protein
MRVTGETFAKRWKRVCAVLSVRECMLLNRQSPA